MVGARFKQDYPPGTKLDSPFGKTPGHSIDLIRLSVIFMQFL